jgi:hypothetical protein
MNGHVSLYTFITRNAEVWKMGKWILSSEMAVTSTAFLVVQKIEHFILNKDTLMIIRKAKN